MLGMLAFSNHTCALCLKADNTPTSSQFYRETTDMNSEQKVCRDAKKITETFLKIMKKSCKNSDEIFIFCLYGEMSYVG